MAAKRVARDLGLSVRYLVADARYLPFPAASFDQVFSYSVLQHMAKQDVELVLGEVARVLTPGGSSLIQMASAFGLRSLYHQVRRGFREPRSFEVRYWRPGELRTVFSRIVGASALSADWYFGLGLQPADSALMPISRRTLLAASEFLRRLGQRSALVRYLADSLYVCSRREAEVSSLYATSSRHSERGTGYRSPSRRARREGGGGRAI
jgi:SAM-dependent methyltransferase